MVDALIVWAEEGRVHKRDIVGESLRRRLTGSFRMGQPPFMKVEGLRHFDGRGKLVN